MYKNSGAKVRGLATVITTLMMIGSALFGFMIMALTEEPVVGLIFGALGCFLAWLSGLLLAAFGEMAENIYHLRKMMAKELEYIEKEDENTEEKMADSLGVTDEDIRMIMHRDGVGIGDAMRRAQEEKLAARRSAGQEQSF